MPVLSLESLNDEEYLIRRSKTATNPYDAKSWMTTAKLMFPDDFDIQYEAYNVEKCAERVEESAKYLKSMFNHFNNDSKLWTELNEIIELLRNESSSSFGSRVFRALSIDVQEKILTQAAMKNVDDLAQHCKLMLLLFKRFPDTLRVQGPELIQRLLSSLHKNDNDDDDLHHLIVSEVCPTLLRSNFFELNDATLEDLVSMTVDYLYGRISNKNSIHWTSVFESVEEIGRRLRWTLTQDLKDERTDVLAKRILNRQPRNNSAEFYFLSAILFAKTFSEYLAESSSSSTLADFILVEAFVTHDVNQEGNSASAKIKRRRTTDEERRQPLITDDSSLKENFAYSVHFYQLLHSDPDLEIQFKRLLSKTARFHQFIIDVLIYEAKYREALQVLRQSPTPASTEEQGRFHLKMATVHYCLKDSNAASDQVIQAIACLPEKTEDNEDSDENKADFDSSKLQRPTSKTRHLHFLPYRRHAILSYVTRILINLLKERGFQPPSLESDLALGHVLVLLQYSWPCETDLFYLIIHRIRMKESFAYPFFCNYIVEIEFLEEFMWLASQQGGSVTLDIVPQTNPSQNTGRRVGTRGANRGEKEEFRTALRRQVQRSHESKDQIIIDFLTNNRDSIFQCLI